MSVDLANLERIVAKALCSSDPQAALQAAQTDATLAPELRAALSHAKPDGFAIAALIVARLRFERLMQGSSLAIEWFARDPAQFTAAFKRYHVSTPSDHLMPAEEAATFELWVGADAP